MENFPLIHPLQPHSAALRQFSSLFSTLDPSLPFAAAAWLPYVEYFTYSYASAPSPSMMYKQHDFSAEWEFNLRRIKIGCNTENSKIMESFIRVFPGFRRYKACGGWCTMRRRVLCVCPPPKKKKANREKVSIHSHFRPSFFFTYLDVKFRNNVL